MKLFRISNVLILALATGLGGALFWTSQKVQIKQDALSALSSQSQHEQESLSVLTAEWDYLNRPQRLEQLAQEYLHVSRPEEKTIVTNASVIMEPAPAPEPFSDTDIVPASLNTAPAAPKQAPVPAPSAPVIERNDSERFQTLLQNLSGGQ